MPATPAVTRKDLLTALIPVGLAISRVEIKEVLMGPNQPAPLHLHPCPVVGVVTQGTIAFQIEGQAVQYLHTGQAFYEPANARVARFDNDGEEPARFVAFYLLAAGQDELIRVLDS